MMPAKMTAGDRTKPVRFHLEIVHYKKKESHGSISCGSHDEAALLSGLSFTLFTLLLPARTVAAGAGISFFSLEPMIGSFLGVRFSFLSVTSTAGIGAHLVTSIDKQIACHEAAKHKCRNINIKSRCYHSDGFPVSSSPLVTLAKRPNRNLPNS